MLFILLFWGVLHELLHAAAIVYFGEEFQFGFINTVPAVACVTCMSAASQEFFYWASNVAYADMMANAIRFLLAPQPQNDFFIIIESGNLNVAIFLPLFASVLWIWMNIENIRNWRKFAKKVF